MSWSKSTGEWLHSVDGSEVNIRNIDSFLAAIKEYHSKDAYQFSDPEPPISTRSTDVDFRAAAGSSRADRYLDKSLVFKPLPPPPHFSSLMSTSWSSGSGSQLEKGFSGYSLPEKNMGSSGPSELLSPSQKKAPFTFRRYEEVQTLFKHHDPLLTLTSYHKMPEPSDRTPYYIPLATRSEGEVPTEITATADEFLTTYRRPEPFPSPSQTSEFQPPSVERLPRKDGPTEVKVSTNLYLYFLSNVIYANVKPK
jgi:hypothetical protein